MKKLLFVIIIAAFIFGCKSEDNNDDNGPTDTTEITIDENVVIDTDTTEIILSEEEVSLKSDDILKKSEEIITEIDDLLNNL